VHDALGRFAEQAPVAGRCGPSTRGPGYLRLGEPRRRCPAAKASGCGSRPGCAAARGVLYVFEEPRRACTRSTWAHSSAVFDRLLDAGATIIVIDHDLGPARHGRLT